MISLVDRYDGQHETRIFLHLLLVLVNGVGTTTTLESVEAFRTDVEAAVRDLCEKDATKTDKDDSRVERLAHKRIEQEAEHLGDVARVLGPYTRKSGDMGATARALVDVVTTWRTELKRAEGMTYYVRHAASLAVTASAPLAITLEELSDTGDTLPEFLRDLI